MVAAATSRVDRDQKKNEEKVNNYSDGHQGGRWQHYLHLANYLL